MKEKEVEIKEGNISLILESYNDIFSSFDPRPSSERALSDDFLIECKRSARDKEGVFELRLLLPPHKRNTNEEAMIKKRLKDHFKKHFKSCNHVFWPSVIRQGRMSGKAQGDLS